MARLRLFDWRDGGRSTCAPGHPTYQMAVVSRAEKDGAYGDDHSASIEIYKQAACTTAVRLQFIDDSVMAMARNTSLAGIDDTVCSADTTEFECRCFAYSYEKDVQIWKEYQPGSAVPTDLSNGTSVLLSEEGNISGRYLFEPLPAGVLGSDGEVSSYMFDRKAVSLAEQTGCAEICAPATE